MSSFVFGLAIFPQNNDVGLFLLGLAGLILIYFGIMKRLKSYVTFDSRKQEGASKFWDWGFWGLATFLFFGTLFYSSSKVLAWILIE